ncbi:DUF992 domain-containing protein [Bradyrhizobium sp. STM 3809]|uniref:DUF992 domain-containing protein n=1 Tax=Bradyrhizobium sp. STM 3809 TaxID=551936 RepID=UPI000240815C|nr:DUF992 domain-containing protein [Bradyrhizobium sp. STM 3809]CCD98381.1 conserved exported hypothetical protein [Bradyrhizobium sp. STM 3809]
MRLLVLSTVAMVMIMPLAQAHQGRPMRAGVLECEGRRTTGRLVMSQARLRCVFRSQGREPERYVARVRRYGLDLGLTDETRMAWAVNAPVNDFGRSELRGRYGGVTANAAALFGFGGSFLVRDSDRAAALQPISLQGQTGLNLAAGITEVELVPLLPIHPSPSQPSSYFSRYYR